MAEIGQFLVQFSFINAKYFKDGVCIFWPKGNFCFTPETASQVHLRIVFFWPDFFPSIWDSRSWRWSFQSYFILEHCGTLEQSMYSVLYQTLHVVLFFHKYFILFCKASVRSKNLTALALALSRRSCARARTHAQFFQDLALALKTFERRSILRSF